MFIASGLVIVLHKKRWLTIHTPPWLLLFVQVVLGISVGATISLSELGTTLTLPVIVGLVCCLTLQIISSYLWLTKKRVGRRLNLYSVPYQVRWPRFW